MYVLFHTSSSIGKGLAKDDVRKQTVISVGMWQETVASKASAEGSMV